MGSEHCALEIAKAAKASWDPRVDVCIARVKNDELMGGVLYTSFTGESIQMHVAAWDDHWITHDLLWVAFDYPFRQLGVKRIFGHLPSDNEVALAFNKNVGFKEIYRIKGVYPYDVDGVLMCMERHECRFLRMQPRKIHSNQIEA